MSKYLLNLFIGLLAHISFITLGQACFVVHYVLYFKDIPMKYYLHMSQNSSFPYIVHLNQPLNLPNNKTFTRQILPVEMSDIKKMQIVYHHGGLYLDNDQFIDYACVRQKICPLTGLYFLDWTDIKQRWKITVPLSFIYSSHPLNQTLKQSLQALNESIQGPIKGPPRTVFFSGPAHMQQFRSGMSFVKVPKRCQFHRADRSWVEGKPQNQIKYQTSVENKVLKSYNNEQKKSKQIFTDLWSTKTVIYPLGFDLKIQTFIDDQFNHVEMVDKTYCKIRVIQYSKFGKNRKKLEQFIQKHNGTQLIQKQSKIELKNPDQLIKVQEMDKIQVVNLKKKQISESVIAPSTNEKQMKTEEKQIKEQVRDIQISNVLIDFFSSNQYHKLVFLMVLIVGCAILCFRKKRCCHNNNFQDNHKKKVIIYQSDNQLEQQCTNESDRPQLFEQSQSDIKMKEEKEQEKQEELSQIQYQISRSIQKEKIVN